MMLSRLRAATEPLRRGTQLARLAWGLPAYLRVPLTLEQAQRNCRQRLERRAENFLAVARDLIYASGRGPVRQLLRWAGCEYGDLESMVARAGLEQTLEQLRDNGVYFTHDEFTGSVPLCRSGLTLEIRATDFDNPFVTGKSLSGSTSATRSPGVRVVYSWQFLAEEAANELLLYAAHGVARAPLAFWMPGMPALSGIHNFLIDLKTERPPTRWFSHVQGSRLLGLSFGSALQKVLLRAAMDYVVWCSRRFSDAVPAPEFTPIGDALRVATWLADAIHREGSAVLKTYTSSAVRVAQAAREHNLDLGGSIIFTGGEPLTARRRRFIESSGARARPRYVATESGLIAGACAAGEPADDMHVYTDRIAIIGAPNGQLLLTALSPHTGKILLNVDLGDCGRLDRRRCGCLLGEQGMDVHLSDVHSLEKLTGEGMTVLAAELDDIVGAVIEQAGGSPDDYQFWEREQETGLTQVIVVVSPRLTHVTDDMVRDAILETLRRRHLRGDLSAHMWQQAETLRIVRETPRLTSGQKLLPVVRESSEPSAPTPDGS